jgi:hypothetical protein
MPELSFEIFLCKMHQVKKKKKIFFTVINEEVSFRSFVDDVPFKIDEEKCTRNKTKQRLCAAHSARPVIDVL